MVSKNQYDEQAITLGHTKWWTWWETAIALLFIVAFISIRSNFVTDVLYFRFQGQEKTVWLSLQNQKIIALTIHASDFRGVIFSSEMITKSDDSDVSIWNVKSNRFLGFEVTRKWFPFDYVVVIPLWPLWIASIVAVWWADKQDKKIVMRIQANKLDNFARPSGAIGSLSTSASASMKDGDSDASQSGPMKMGESWKQK